MSYPGGKHAPGHYAGAGAFQGQFVLRGCGSVTIQQESGAALQCDMPTHQTGDLLVVGVSSQGTNFSVAGWTNAMALTSAGRTGPHWKIAASAAETFLIPINIDTEAGRFAQCCAYSTPADAVSDTFDATKTVSASNGDDDGIFVRVGAKVEPFSDTLVMITGMKVGVDFDPDPPGSASIGGLEPFAKHSFTFENEWEVGAKRWGGFYFGQLFEENADAIADGLVVQTPGEWSQAFDPVASGSRSVRFRIP